MKKSKETAANISLRITILSILGWFIIFLTECISGSNLATIVVIYIWITINALGFIFGIFAIGSPRAFRIFVQHIGNIGTFGYSSYSLLYWKFRRNIEYCIKLRIFV